MLRCSTRSLFNFHPKGGQKESAQDCFTDTLYGMRTAASNWEKEYSNTSEMVGFCPGRAAVVAFYHAEREVRIVVHRDDFVVEGKQSDLE